MEFPLVSEFISNVGFPIAVTVALFHQMNKTQEANNNTIAEFRKVIQNNTEQLVLLNNNVDKMKRITTELRYVKGGVKQDDV